jgi:hypothetical protein|tara:strand:- start:1188 stop:1655 length:468 start_codon:yes stop_codon:yes gene_type:complete
MQVYIRGGSKRQKQLVRSMAEFCHQKLMPRMGSIIVNFQLKNFGRDDSLGYCIPEDNADPHRPREFEIEIHKNQRNRRLLETVAHEMVHVKQFARGELYENSANKHRWQGTWLNKDPEYWDAPWEIEAHGREIGLFVQWAEKNKLGHLKWTQSSK